MRPMFIEVRSGVKYILWAKFILFATGVILLLALLGEAVAYLAMGRFGLAAPAAGAILGFLGVTRQLLSILAYQPTERDDVVTTP
ncbi:hypothetical protein [Paludisphaera mucosa]|uniref:Uncharacterized protein n=1 Tax=Paludisphaera mucosa TaxID=3030827 RepID=A0ABT6F7F4_9BACT|nr:hypothetical protein [Paludisphaera mucosa]MDG3003416.1 hypothetical protein [Paludisphaera mucosa]